MKFLIIRKIKLFLACRFLEPETLHIRLRTSGAKVAVSFQPSHLDILIVYDSRLHFLLSEFA
jgi:hypothetical protein